MRVGYTVIEENIKKLKEKCDKVIYVDQRFQGKKEFLTFVKNCLSDSIYTYGIEDIGLQLIHMLPALQEIKMQGKVIFFLNKGAGIALSDDEFNDLLIEIGNNDKKNTRQKKVINSGVLGRPKIDQAVIEQITKLHHQEKRTIREIAQICNVSIGTAHKYVTNYGKIKSNELREDRKLDIQ